MGKIIHQTMTRIMTDDGLHLIRRVTKVLMPNGKYRYPVDYFEASSDVVRVSDKELDNLCIPGYKMLV
jgi:hypothetical protein